MPEKKSKNFTSPDCARRFRRALAGVPATARIEKTAGRTVLLIRPHNLLVFGASLIKRGLQHCAESNRILRHLDRNKEEFIRFEHHAD